MGFIFLTWGYPSTTSIINFTFIVLHSQVQSFIVKIIEPSITPRLAEVYDRIRQDVDCNFDNTNMQNSTKYKIVDYIEKYERGGELNKDIEHHESAKDSVVSISKSKSNELER